MKILAVSLLVLASGCITEPSLFVDKSGDGGGRIISDPAGIDCGEVCGALVTGPVTLVATPDSSSLFVGWKGGGCSGIEPCTVDIATETTVEAVFERGPVIVTIEPSEHGRVTGPGGIDCGDVCSAEFELGSDVVLVAKADTGFSFSRWSDNARLSTRRVTLSESTTLQAVFESNSRLFVGITGAGHVVSSPPGIDCFNGLCEARFDPGTVVTLTALAGMFNGWVDCVPVSGSSNSCVVTVDGTVSVTAMFY